MKPVFLIVLGAVMAAGCCTTRGGSSEGPVAHWLRTHDYAIRLQVSGPSRGIRIRTRVTVPKGPGPFPLVVINHGSPRSSEARRRTARYPAAVRWFTARGYAVAIPNRRGYADSGGGYSEGFGRCDNPNYQAAGLQTARDISAVIRHLRSQPFVQGDRIFVVGQSAGGWGALAVASLNVEGVRGVVNFAGGRGSPASGNNCVPERLYQGASAYGKAARTPSLWIYTKNDRFFGPAVSRRMFRAYQQATRSSATFMLLDAYGRDGHSLFASSKGPATWGGPVERFLQRF